MLYCMDDSYAAVPMHCATYSWCNNDGDGVLCSHWTQTADLWVQCAWALGMTLLGAHSTLLGQWEHTPAARHSEASQQSCVWWLWHWGQQGTAPAQNTRWCLALPEEEEFLVFCQKYKKMILTGQSTRRCLALPEEEERGPNPQLMHALVLACCCF